MGDIPMTFPAFSLYFGRTRKVMITITIGPNRAGQHGMTGDTVLLHPLGCILADLNPLGIGIHGKGSGMIPSIPHLGQILINGTANGKMTLDAGDISGMRTVLPGGIRSIHDMTVDTGLGISRQIGQRPGYIQHIDEQADGGYKRNDGAIF